MASTPIQTRSQDRVSWRTQFEELWSYRYLLRNLVERDIKIRYKNSVLGVLWSLLNPLLMMLVFSLIFNKLLGSSLRDYHIFILVGLLPWNFFNGATMTATDSIMSNSSLVKKVYFPRELLPVSAVLSNLVNFMIACIVLIVFLYASGIGLTVHALWFPVLLVIQIIFTLGLGFILSSLHVFYRDIRMILEVGMLAWFFLTPVVYSIEQFEGQATTIFGIAVEDPARVMRWLNPMATLIDGYRTILWGFTRTDGPAAMDISYILRTFTMALIMLIIGYIVFRRTQHLFGEKL